MNLSNPLPAAWKAILCANEAVKITRRVIVRSPGHSNEECQQALQIFQQGLRKGTLYQGNDALKLLEDETATPSIEMREIEGLFVLYLWATFERFLRDYLQEKGTVLKQYIQPPSLANALYQHFQKNVERWEPKDILYFLKESIFNTPALKLMIDHANHIYTYRNWVAHANPNKKYSRWNLKTTFNTLNDIIEILLQT